MKMEAEAGVMQPEAKGCSGPPGAGRDGEGPPEGGWPCDALPRTSGLQTGVRTDFCHFEWPV